MPGGTPDTFDDGRLVGLLLLGYYLFVEIALAHVPFFAIPALLGWFGVTFDDSCPNVRTRRSSFS